MSTPRPAPPTLPLLRSTKRAIIMVYASELNGPRTRHRLVLRRGQAIPDWLRSFVPYVGSAHDLIVCAMGRARVGSSTRICSVVIYPRRGATPETAFVYVEELDVGSTPLRDACPIHVVLCSALPELVHFIEVPLQERRDKAPLRRV